MQITSSLSDWSGEWVHYTDVNKLGVNPQQFHQDLAGIYLFPKEFKTVGTLWKAKKYKFTVRLKGNARVLDLAKLTKRDLSSLLDKLNISFPKDEELNADSFWDYLKNHYVLSPRGKNVGRWNADLRRLGYDAVFDDTGAIHTVETQLIVLNPKLLQVLNLETQNIKRGQFARLKQHLDYLAELLRPYGEVKTSLKKKKQLYSKEYALRGEARLSLGGEDKRIDWSLDEDEANHGIWVRMDDSTNVPGLDKDWRAPRESILILKDENKDQIKQLVERVMKKVDHPTTACYLERVSAAKAETIKDWQEKRKIALQHMKRAKSTGNGGWVKMLEKRIKGYDQKIAQLRRKK